MTGMLRRWLAASTAVLCFAGSAILLYWAHEFYFVDDLRFLDKPR